MNTRNASVSCAAMMGLLAVTATAGAVPPADPVLDERVAVVSLAGIDTSTPQGAQAAIRRLRETARLLCSRVQDPRDLDPHVHFVACVDRAMATALRQLHGHTVAALGSKKPVRVEVRAQLQPSSGRHVCAVIYLLGHRCQRRLRLRSRRA